MELFAKLVKQDDFLFDFIKIMLQNVSKTLVQKITTVIFLSFLEFYSASYDTMIATVLHSFGGETLFIELKELFLMVPSLNKPMLLNILLWFLK